MPKPPNPLRPLALRALNAGAELVSTPDTIGALEILLRLRWAEALLAAREAEDAIAEYASYEATAAAIADRQDMR